MPPLHLTSVDVIRGGARWHPELECLHRPLFGYRFTCACGATGLLRRAWHTALEDGWAHRREELRAGALGS